MLHPLNARQQYTIKKRLALIRALKFLLSFALSIRLSDILLYYRNNQSQIMIGQMWFRDHAEHIFMTSLRGNLQLILRSRRVDVLFR